MASRRFTVGLVQMRCTADPAENLRRAEAGVREAVRRGARLVCLPELFRTPYFCRKEDARLFDLAESVPGPTTRALARLARRLRVAIVGSVFERRAAGLHHNSAVILDADGRLAGLYRKMHIPDDPLYYEKYYFTPGDLGFQAVPTRSVTVGPLVCWDQWYPEAARLTALRGAQILVYPTAIGWHPKEKKRHGEAQRDAWRTIQRSHAIANGVFVAAINRVGHEGPAGGGLEFWGSSFVFDPFGRPLAEASTGKAEVITAECDLGLLDEVRRNWPFLRDRRIDAYAGIAERFLDGKARRR
jgi:N-carbamoylputrescine amidase